MFSKDYTVNELMAVACSKEIKDYDVCFVGIGVPMMAGLVASKTHALNATIVYEAGGLGAISRRMPWTISDNPTSENALMATEMWRIFSDTQAGYINKGITGGAQVDKYGNLNTTVILNSRGKTGTYEQPLIRLPGSGGANDIASSCEETVIMMKLAKGKFVEKVDYITSPGYLTGGNAREKAGLKGKGPVSMVTNKGIFRFDDETKEMYLESIFPNVTVEEIKEYFEWDLKVSDNLKVVDPPLESEVELIRTSDPKGIILGAKAVDEEETFDDFYNTMKAVYEAVVIEL